MNMVVTGATGHIGNVLIRELLAAGEKIRALVPPFENDLPIRGLNIDMVAGDVCDPDSLNSAFRGADVVYHLAGIIAITPGKERLLHRVNVEGTRNVVDACLESGVGRLVYTSSIHAIQERPRATLSTRPSRWTRSTCSALMPGVRQGDSGGKRGGGTRLNAVIVHPTGRATPSIQEIGDGAACPGIHQGKA